MSLWPAGEDEALKRLVNYLDKYAQTGHQYIEVIKKIIKLIVRI